jgi:uncharacterized RDD family membrane protein YckC
VHAGAGQPATAATAPATSPAATSPAAAPAPTPPQTAPAGNAATAGDVTDADDAGNTATAGDATGVIIRYAADDIVQPRDRARSRAARGTNDAIVSVFGDSTLEAGQTTDSVVSVFGSSTSFGEVRDAVVSVLGNTRVEAGKVGDSAVAVLGNTYVNAEVGEGVVAILGDVELGPDAKVHGNVAAIGGQLLRDPAARIDGNVQRVTGLPQNALIGIRSWVRNCLLFLRPLAFAPGLGWAWTIALGVLALYTLLAVLFRDPLDRCVKTLQARPGETIIAALLTVVLTPLLYVILAITVIGIAFIPIASFGLFLASLFGKAVVLAWIGHGVLKIANRDEAPHSAIAVLVGGVIVLLLYVVPVLGFLVFNLLGILGVGAIVYTLLLAIRARRAGTTPASPATAASGTPDGEAAYATRYDTQTLRQDAAGAAGMAGAAAASAADTMGHAEPATSGSTDRSSSEGTAERAAEADETAGSHFGNPDAAANPDNDGASTAPPAANGSADALSLPRAGFWIRMLALAIDAILIGVVLSMLEQHARVQLIALAAYGAIMWKLKGTTLGGIICNLRIVRIDGREIDWSTAIVRALGCFLSLIVAGLGFAWIAFDPARQAWHDKIAGTAVVRVPQGVSLL